MRGRHRRSLERRTAARLLTAPLNQPRRSPFSLLLPAAPPHEQVQQTINTRADNTLRQFGVSVEPNMTALKGRRLPPPQARGGPAAAAGSCTASLPWLRRLPTKPVIHRAPAPFSSSLFRSCCTATTPALSPGRASPEAPPLLLRCATSALSVACGNALAAALPLSPLSPLQLPPLPLARRIAPRRRASGTSATRSSTSP